MLGRLDVDHTLSFIGRLDVDRSAVLVWLTIRAQYAEFVEYAGNAFCYGAKPTESPCQGGVFVASIP